MRKLVVALGAIVVLVLVVLLVGPRLVPTDTLRSWLTSGVKQATGRDLTIAGPIRFAVLPRLAAEADDVALANAPGGQAPDLLRLKSLQVELRLLPLLHGSFEVARFVLDTPVIALERDAQGRPNWQFGTATPAAAPNAVVPAAPAAPGAGGASGAPFGGFSLGEVRLVDGAVSYLDRHSGAAWKAEGINLELSPTGGDRPFSAKGSARWNGQPVALTLTLARPLALFGGGDSDLALHLAASPATLDFTGHLAGLSPVRLTGTLDAAAPSLRDLLGRFGANDALPGTAPGALTAKGKLALDGSKMSLDDATVVFDAMALAGSVAVDSTGARPALTAKLTTTGFDPNAWLPTGPAGTTKPADGGGAGQAGWSDAPLDLAALNAVDAELAVSGGPILWQALRIDRADVAVHLKGGKLAADLKELALYQGAAKGTAKLDGTGTPTLELHADIAKVQLAPLLAAIGASDRLSGVASFTIDATGNGTSEKAIVGSLAGRGKFGMADGRVSGVNLLALASNAATGVLGGGSTANETAIGSLGGTYTIDKGVVHNDDLALTSGSVPMKGAGTIDLPQRRLDYRLTPQLARAVGVPLRVAGPWDDVRVTPDLAGLAAQPGQALESLKSVAPTAPSVGGAAGALKNLFGH